MFMIDDSQCYDYFMKDGPSQNLTKGDSLKILISQKAYIKFHKIKICVIFFSH